jgi:ribosomal protein S18 acetylase RimI-like enzyme
VSADRLISLGPARLHDFERIAHMSRELIEPGLPWSWTPRRVLMQMRDREAMLVVARAAGELAGFAIAHFGFETVHLNLLATAPAHRRQGVGRRLIAWIEEAAIVAGLFQINLEVREHNVSARRFYAALGYVECGSMPRYYSGVEDAIRLSHDLRVGSPEI